MMTEKLLNLRMATEAPRKDGSRVALYRGLAMPAGVESFVIRDGRTGIEYDGTTMPSVALRIFREVFALPAPAQIESPLPAAERQSSGLAGGGAAANAMSAPVRAMLASCRRRRSIERGRLADGNYPIRMLKAAARRGWLALDDQIRPTFGTLTDAGRKALARELTSIGGAR